MGPLDPSAACTDDLQKSVPFGAIAFQISLRATFVILNVVKDQQLFFLLCEAGWRSGEDGPAPSCRNEPKGNCRSFVAALLRMTKR